MLRLKDTLESTVTYALEAGNAAKLGSVAASKYVTTDALSSSTSNITADNAHRLSAYGNNDIANSFFYRNGTPTSGWTGFPSSVLATASACTPYIGSVFYNKSVSVLHTGSGSGLRRHDLVFLNNSSSSTVDGFLYLTNNRSPAYVLDTQNYKSKGNVFDNLTASNSTVNTNLKVNGQVQAASSSCTRSSVVNLIATNSTLTNVKATNIIDGTIQWSRSLVNLAEQSSGTSWDTVTNWSKLGTNVSYVASLNKLVNQPAQYGNILSISSGNYGGVGDVTQIFQTVGGSNWFHRGGNPDRGWDYSWSKFLDDRNYKEYTLSLSGGTLQNGAQIVWADSGTWGQSGVSYPRYVGGFYWSGQSDYARLFTEETGGDNLDLVMQFGDDNSNGLSIRDAGNGQTAYISASGNIYAQRVYNAVYNDYAELFPRGESTEPGDIIALDISCDKEQYVKATISSKRIVGVHSDEYGHLIGGDQPPKEYRGSFEDYNIKKYIPVGLVGRCRVKVIGPVSKGDDIIPTDIPGVGRAWNESTDSDRLLRKSVGFAVESSTDPAIKFIRVKLTD